MRRLTVFVLYFSTVFTQVLVGQSVVQKGYFMFPIKPGQQNYLTGSMGELRSNHFHAGIDVKTDFKVGLPVYCSADGYVSRLKLSTQGYGNVLYITHPNGLTTVYAHLEKLNESLALWALNKQYELESFEIDVYPSPNELVVKKGQVIATSGNTGHSGGPHLHYEVRDEKENVWNPLLFGFNEIKDNENPEFEYVAFRTFSINGRVENEFGKKDFKPVKNGKNFSIQKPIQAIGTIGIEIKAHDRMNETHNHYGISCVEVKVNGKETFFHNINSFSFPDGKKINAHIDYETLIARNQRFQRCYVSDGNSLASYKKSTHNGKLEVQAGQTYEVEITIYDAYYNNSTLRFTIQGKSPEYIVPSTEVTKGGYRIFENILKIKGKVAKDTTGTLYSKGKETVLAPAYIINKYPVYLYDLRNGLPDSIVLKNYSVDFDFVAVIPPFTKKSFSISNFHIDISDTALIDTLYLELNISENTKGKKQLEIHNPMVPVFGKIQISYQPEPGEEKHPKSYIALNGRKYEDSEWKEDKLVAETKYFGKFVIVKDTIKPSASYISHTSKSIRCTINDKESGIASFRATLNGKWLLMHYEHKSRILWSENQDKTTPLKGKFVLEVTDNVGNVFVLQKQL